MYTYRLRYTPYIPSVRHHVDMHTAGHRCSKDRTFLKWCQWNSEYAKYTADLYLEQLRRFGRLSVDVYITGWALDQNPSRQPHSAIESCHPGALFVVSSDTSFVCRPCSGPVMSQMVSSLQVLELVGWHSVIGHDMPELQSDIDTDTDDMPELETGDELAHDQAYVYSSIPYEGYAHEPLVILVDALSLQVVTVMPVMCTAAMCNWNIGPLS